MLEQGPTASERARALARLPEVRRRARVRRRVRAAVLAGAISWWPWPLVCPRRWPARRDPRRSMSSGRGPLRRRRPLPRL